MAQHTPGPWAFEDPLGPEILSVVVGSEPYNWRHIAQISAAGNRSEGDVSKTEAKANVLLIAAAPDLLEAAKEAKQILDCIASVAGMSTMFGAPEADSTADKLTRAIAKAEGR